MPSSSTSVNNIINNNQIKIQQLRKSLNEEKMKLNNNINSTTTTLSSTETTLSSTETIIFNEKGAKILSLVRDFIKNINIQNLINETNPISEITRYNNTTNRKVSTQGDPNLSYSYDNHTKISTPWTPTVLIIKKKIEEYTKESFNFVVINLYENGNSAIGPHSDNEESIIPYSTIASISFGAPRLFRISEKRTKTNIITIPLIDSSLLLMQGTCQEIFNHEILKNSSLTERRINLTFRKINNNHNNIKFTITNTDSNKAIVINNNINNTNNNINDNNNINNTNFNTIIENISFSFDTDIRKSKIVNNINNNNNINNINTPFLSNNLSNNQLKEYNNLNNNNLPILSNNLSVSQLKEYNNNLSSIAHHNQLITTNVHKINLLQNNITNNNNNQQILQLQRLNISYELKITQANKNINSLLMKNQKKNNNKP
jgi:alkylated DNA repair dioxygenase AlkB